MLFAYGAALGAQLGVELENALLLVPAAVAISVAHRLLAGFESYLPGFAHDGVLRYLWGIGSWWPVSAITDQIRFDVESFTQAGVDPVLHGFDGTSTSELAALAASSLAGLLLGAWAYRREARLPPQPATSGQVIHLSGVHRHEPLGGASRRAGQAGPANRCVRLNQFPESSRSTASMP